MVVTPDGPQDLVASEHLRAVLQQIDEQLELGRGQPDRFAGHGHPPRDQVDLQRLRADRRGSAVCRPQLRPNSGGELADREGLDEVVDGTGVEAGDPVRHLPAGGQHDHRQLRPDLPQPLENLGPAQFREHQVEYDELDVGLQRTSEPCLAVGCAVHLEPVPAQPPLDEIDDALLVLDHQDHGAIIGPVQLGKEGWRRTYPRKSKKSLRTAAFREISKARVRDA